MVEALVVVLLLVLAAAGGALIALRRQAGRALGPATGPTGALAGGIDPFTIGEPWRHFVRDAQRAQSRFREVVDRTPGGPLRERLEDIARQLDRGVAEVWATAQRGHDLGRARNRIDTVSVRRRLDDQRAAVEQARAADPLSLDDTAARTADSLERQLDSARRLDEVREQAEARLRLLQAQLDEAVARAAELGAATVDAELTVAGVGEDVEHVVVEIEALRLALEETSEAERGGSTA
jgi:hypothetical protein